MSKNKSIIVFAGPQESGKTTIINNIRRTQEEEETEEFLAPDFLNLRHHRFLYSRRKPCTMAKDNIKILTRLIIIEDIAPADFYPVLYNIEALPEPGHHIYFLLATQNLELKPNPDRYTLINLFSL